MFAVIFTATAGDQDDAYSVAVNKMRQLAFEKYGCLDFVAVTEGDKEIAISYWPDEEHISQWKRDPEHLLAQSIGQTNWYRDYKVEVVEIKRQYKFSG